MLKIRKYCIGRSTFGVVVVLLLSKSNVTAQTGITHQFTFAAHGTYSHKRNGPEDSHYGFQVSASEIHHLTKNIGFEYGLAYDLVQAKHSVDQIDLASHKRYALSHLRFHSVGIPINLRYFFNKKYSLFLGVQNAYAFGDVTKVYNVRYRYDEVMHDSHKTLLSTNKGSYRKTMLNAYQVGFNYNLDLDKYYWQFGLEYARYAQSFNYAFNTENYTYGLSRFTMRVGFWFAD